MASSGIAAPLLPGGRTAHSRFKIPLDLHCRITTENLGYHMGRGTYAAQDCFEAVDRTLRDILRNDDLFGGISTIFGGDIAQILPVVRKGQRPQIVSACLQQSYIGARLQIRKLTENMRVQGADPDYRQFVQWLSDLSYVPELNTFIQPPPAVSNSTSLQEFDTQVYPDEVLQNAPLDSTLFSLSDVS